MRLRATDFGAFFHAIHEHYPFPWQQTLVEQVAEHDSWPDTLRLPTGAGKTAALDIAVFHLALQSKLTSNAALRIVYVVDRRLVVDDAFARAEKIAKALCYPPNINSHGVDTIKEVAARLQQLAGTKGMQPLVARRLRGGMPLQSDWARTPTQPMILCSTVDQIGSRLLFRGYGVSNRMRPVHAGLLGVNSLILVDEAHLSQPFQQTLDSVKSVGGAKIQRVFLSATPIKTEGQNFSLSPEDREHPELKKRLEASKPVSLTALGKDASPEEIFAEMACKDMQSLMSQNVSSPAVGIIVNRVNLARNIFSTLSKKLNCSEIAEAEITLMIGRSRDVDRGKIAKYLKPFQTNAKDRGEAFPLFVVATQCLEVGVDLDLDALVTQAAPLDALRQRFGRLNRAGRSTPTKGTILACPKDIDKNFDDPVYGSQILETWMVLKKIYQQDGLIDFGICYLPQKLASIGITPSDLATKFSSAPVVMPTYLDLWSCTSPPPAADPDVALFLHGSGRVAAGVSIVWRGDVSCEHIEDAEKYCLAERMRLVPPRAAEAIEIPLWMAKAWLDSQEASFASISDAPERRVFERESLTTVARKSQRKLAFRWAGVGDLRTETIQNSAHIQTGDILVVPTEYGWCDEFGWADAAVTLVKDVADEAAEPYWGRRCAVRVARDCVRTDSEWSRLVNLLRDDSVDIQNLLMMLINAIPYPKIAEQGGPKDDAPPPRDISQLLKALQNAKGVVDIFPYGLEHNDQEQRGGVILYAKKGVDVSAKSLDFSVPVTEDDGASIRSSQPILLDDHHFHVAKFVRDYAETLGLGDLANDLYLAACLHDAGKADMRFQIMLSGGDPWNRRNTLPLAKSGRSLSPKAWSWAGLPKGWRHEALSVRMAQSHPLLTQARDPALVLWLIGTHHGWGRPCFGFLDKQTNVDLHLSSSNSSELSDADLPPGPQSLTFDFHGYDWPSLFKVLKHKYGIWNLAYLEAILRLADHRASEEEEVYTP